MNNLLRGIAVIFSLLMAFSAQSEVLLLVHGYAADASSWEHSGVSERLAARGWKRAGLLNATPTGMEFLPGPGIDADKRAYVANLPAQAPLMIQSSQLRSMLDGLRQQFPDERLTLVGHSAGGVVSRLALTNDNLSNVDRLITIASPHLGTMRAEQGMELIDTKPFFCPGPGIDFLKSVLGGSRYRYVRNSRSLLVDLLPVESGNVLSWLNQQPHPDIAYYSVIRRSANGVGDDVVPAYSQDMNNVPVLRGKARVILASTGHTLSAGDGTLIADILDNRY